MENKNCDNNYSNSDPILKSQICDRNISQKQEEDDKSNKCQ